MPENERSISQSDLDSFTEKLNNWGQSLPENEQTLLRVVLAQAAVAEASEVEGFRPWRQLRFVGQRVALPRRRQRLHSRKHSARRRRRLGHPMDPGLDPNGGGDSLGNQV